VVTGFEDSVRRALVSLPVELVEKLENVAVVIEDEDRRRPDTLGLFESEPNMPHKITIFRLPLEADFGDDPAELERQIQITVLHELAHYFGLDEGRLDELGYG
jgi:predicted Zn-dependent protease with MMP-like domain